VRDAANAAARVPGRHGRVPRRGAAGGLARRAAEAGAARGQGVPVRALRAPGRGLQAPAAAPGDAPHPVRGRAAAGRGRGVCGIRRRERPTRRSRRETGKNPFGLVETERRSRGHVPELAARHAARAFARLEHHAPVSGRRVQRRRARRAQAGLARRHRRVPRGRLTGLSGDALPLRARVGDFSERDAGHMAEAFRGRRQPVGQNARGPHRGDPQRRARRAAGGMRRAETTESVRFLGRHRI
jgi:hypothetical protein